MNYTKISLKINRQFYLFSKFLATTIYLLVTRKHWLKFDCLIMKYNELNIVNTDKLQHFIKSYLNFMKFEVNLAVNKGN